MGKQVYISADDSESDGDRDVVEKLNQWGGATTFIKWILLIRQGSHGGGSVSNETDCRICDLKTEFNR